MRDLLVILLVVLIVFGTKKLRTIGSDLGAAVKGFRQGLSGADARATRARDPHPERPDAEFAESAAPQRTERESS